VEIIALVFFILTLFVVHSNFFKLYNSIFILFKNTVFYLFCFFFFVRVDILNSIHSFNSFSISNNFNNYLIYVFFFITYVLYTMIKNFIKKFDKHNKNVLMLLFFFKLVNCIFIFYFFINMFFIIYLNYQFIDITKYIKYILLLLLFVYSLFELNYKNTTSVFVLGFLCFMFCYSDYINILVFFILINLVFLYKHYLFSNTIVIVSHTLFFYFILYIKYNYAQLYYNIDLLCSFNMYTVNSDYIYTNSVTNNNFNQNSIFNFILFNFNQNQSFNDFYFYKVIHINNILISNSILGYYNFENFISLLFYNVHIIYYMIIILVVLFI
jgi:hypothetical protein